MGQRSRQLTKVRFISIVSLTIALVLSFPEVTSAHRPLFTNTRAEDPDSAIRIPDPSVSHVIYAELTEESPYKWFVFETDRPLVIPLQLGVPSGVSQGAIRPMVALFGPGWSNLPEELPVPMPPGQDVGAITIPLAELPHTFYEPVTGTESQILIDTQVQLPGHGNYYGVVYDANGEEGKVWVSIGSSEGFSWRDVSRLPGWIRAVRRFHEVSGWPRWAWMGTLGLLATILAVTAWVRRRRVTRTTG